MSFTLSRTVWLITVLSASRTSLKFSGYDFIICPILVQLSHFSCLFCEAMIGWACIAIQVNISCILTPIKFCLALKIFKKRGVFCHNLFLLGKRKPTTYLTFQKDRRPQLMAIFSNFGPVGPNVEISSTSHP